MSNDPKNTEALAHLDAVMQAALADAEALARRDDPDAPEPGQSEPAAAAEPAADVDDDDDLDLFAGMDDDGTEGAFGGPAGQSRTAGPGSAADPEKEQAAKALAEAAKRVRKMASGGEIDLLRNQVKHLRDRVKDEEERAVRFERQLEVARNDLKSTRKRFATVAEREDELNNRITRLQLELPRKTTTDVLSGFLPALDSTDAVLKNLLGDQELPARAREAVELLSNAWRQSLQAMQLQAFDAEGQPFDPAVHHAISEVETDEIDPGTCVRQVGRGYLHEFRLLRAAQVVVAKPTAAAADSE